MVFERVNGPAPPGSRTFVDHVDQGQGGACGLAPERGCFEGVVGPTLGIDVSRSLGQSLCGDRTPKVRKGGGPSAPRCSCYLPRIHGRLGPEGRPMGEAGDAEDFHPGQIIPRPISRWDRWLGGLANGKQKALKRPANIANTQAQGGAAEGIAPTRRLPRF